MVADEMGRIAVAPDQHAPGRGSLSGQVFDSTANAPLGGAAVSLLGTNLRTTSDAEGRYSLANVPVGEFYLTFSHRVADLLKLPAAAQRVVVREGEAARVDLAVPGPATLIPTLCPAAEGASAESVVLGTVQEADGDQPVEGAIVHLSTHVLGVLAAPLDLEKISAWKVAGIAGPESASRFETVADRHGNFLLCGIPAGLRLYAGAIDPREGAARSRILYFTTRPGTHMAKLRMAPRPELSEGS